jgi:hypothetical protein
MEEEGKTHALTKLQLLLRTSTTPEMTSNILNIEYAEENTPPSYSSYDSTSPATPQCLDLMSGPFHAPNAEPLCADK